MSAGYPVVVDPAAIVEHVVDVEVAPWPVLVVTDEVDVVTVVTDVPLSGFLPVSARSHVAVLLDDLSTLVPA